MHDLAATTHTHTMCTLPLAGGVGALPFAKTPQDALGGRMSIVACAFTH